MRVVSLLPAVTDWLAAFGATDLLVGRTHLCDAPGTEDVPVVTRRRADLGETPRAIEDAVQRCVQDGLSPFALDPDRLRDLAPDLVVTQAVCGACAPPLSDVTAALADWTDAHPEIVDFGPATLKQVLDATLDLGRRIGRLEAAMRVLAEGEARFRRLRDRIEPLVGESGRPAVACIEWVDPPYAAGHWTPDLIEHAGGTPNLPASGERSPQVEWEAADDADVLVLSACGRTVPQTLRDLEQVDAWRRLAPVQSGRAVVLDGDRLINRPGPSLVRSAEVLAWALWGEASGIAVSPDEAVRLRAPGP